MTTKPPDLKGSTISRRSTGDASTFLEAQPEIGLMVTDPPWGIGGGGRFAACTSYAKLGPAEIAAKLEPGRQRLIKGGHAYIFAPVGPMLPEILDAFRTKGWRFLRLLAWDKGTGKGLGAYRNGFEPVLLFSNGPSRGFQGPPQRYSSLFRDDHVPLRTSKPWTAYKVFMEMSSNPGDLVVDPFCGTNPLERAARVLQPARRWASNDLLTEAQVQADLENRTWAGDDVPRLEAKLEVGT